MTMRIMRIGIDLVYVIKNMGKHKNRNNHAYNSGYNHMERSIKQIGIWRQEVKAYHCYTDQSKNDSVVFHCDIQEEVSCFRQCVN